MRVSNYCTVCGSNNQASVVSCSTCSQKMGQATRRNPINSASFRSPTLVVFDIDDTILDVSQRYKDAKRARIIDKEGYPVRKKTLETPGKARKRANQFLYSPENLRKDRLIPGALALVENLAAQGHTIAYVTARLFNFREVTRNQLEDKGFPLFQDETGSELLFLKPKQSEDSSTYKRGVFDKLNSTYDVRMVFDDKVENLQAAVAVGITGVYPSIQDYTKYQVKSNPRPIVDYDRGEQYVTGTASGEYAYQQRIDEDDEDGRTIAETSYTPEDEQQQQPTLSDFNNPGGIQSKVESILVKEGGAAGLKPLKAAFPKGTTKAQAQAAIAKMSSVYQHPAGDYILKNPGHSGNYMVPRDIHRLGKAADRLEETYEDGQDTPEWWKSKLSVTAKDADTIADSLDYVAENPRSNPPKNKIEKGKKLYKHMNGKDPAKIETKKIDMGDVWYQVGEGGCWSIGYMSGKETGKAEQKYNHTFNEETKDGNFPKLYATMPENGKPLLIIQGGTWKIRTDDKGVAWIYD
jgi:FMN phosphatase YigB (HAD superfamily)